MFLVKLPPENLVRWLFIERDPRLEGCPFSVRTDVEYCDDLAAVVGERNQKRFDWALVGKSRRDRKRFRRFLSREDLRESGYRQVEGHAVEYGSWTEFVGRCGNAFDKVGVASEDDEKAALAGR